MQISGHLISVFQQFLHHDNSRHHGYASRSWGHLLDMLYPGLTSVTDLALKLSLVCERAFANRLSPPGHMCQFLEFWAGSANLTRSLLQAGFHGFGFDWSLSEAHNCLCRNGLKLWIDMLMSVSRDGLVWLGPPCSSFVVLCRCQSHRTATNDYMGDQTRAFVQVGNAHISIAALLFLLTNVLGLTVVLEQPTNSVMQLCTLFDSAITYAKAFPDNTYLGCFNGPTVKPLTLWTNKRCMLQLSRQRPSHADMNHDGHALVTRGPNGSFTGVKDNLQESQVYTPAFGRAVTRVFSEELGLCRRRS